jgi:hypothetical protein
MAEQQRPEYGAPPIPPLAPPGEPPRAMPPPTRRRNMVLLGCLGVAVLALLLGGALAALAVYKVRDTANQAQRAFATTVAPASALATSVALTPALIGSAPPVGAPATAGAGSGATTAFTPVPAARTPPAEGTLPASAPPRAAPPVRGLNQPSVLPGWTVTVVGVERPGQGLAYAADGDPLTATGTWVVVVVTAQKTGNDPVGVTAADCTLRSAAGYTYAVADDAYITVPDYYDTFTHSQPLDKPVPPGATVTYRLPFDVAPNATGLQFVFAPDPATPALFALGNASP